MEKSQSEFKAPFAWQDGIMLGEAFNRIGRALYGKEWKEETICIFNEGNPICSEKEYLTEDQLAIKIEAIGHEVERAYISWLESGDNPDNRNIEQDYNYHFQHLFVYGDNRKLEFPLGRSNIGLRSSEAWDDLFNFDTGSYQRVSDEEFQQFLEVRKTLLQALEKQELENYCQKGSELSWILHNAFKHYNGWFIINDTQPPEYKEVDTAIYTFNITNSRIYESYLNHIQNIWDVRVSPKLDDFIDKLLTGGNKRKGRPVTIDWDNIRKVGLEIIGSNKSPNYNEIGRQTYQKLLRTCKLPSDSKEIARELSISHKKQLLPPKKL